MTVFEFCELVEKCLWLDELYEGVEPLQREFDRLK